METRRLRYFVQITESGSINRAAVALGVAQPALSQQLAILETELKGKLFTRSKAGVTLTEAGQRLYTRAHVILRQIDLLESDLASAPHSVSGLVSIGMPSTLVSCFGIGLISDMVRNFPNLRIHLSEGSGNELASGLQSGLIDMAIVPAIGALQHVDIRPLMKEELFLACGANTPAPPTDPAHLARLPWITTQFPNLLRGAIAGWFVPHGLEPRIVAELNSLRVVLGLVAEGTGVTLLPRTAVYGSEFEQSIRLVPLAPSMFRNLHIAIRTERRGSVAIDAIVRRLDAIATSLATPPDAV